MADTSLDPVELAPASANRQGETSDTLDTVGNKSQSAQCPQPLAEGQDIPSKWPDEPHFSHFVYFLGDRAWEFINQISETFFYRDFIDWGHFLGNGDPEYEYRFGYALFLFPPMRHP